MLTTPERRAMICSAAPHILCSGMRGIVTCIEAGNDIDTNQDSSSRKPFRRPQDLHPAFAEEIGAQPSCTPRHPCRAVSSSNEGISGLCRMQDDHLLA